MNGLPAPLFDVPDTQTVSAGLVAAVLARHAGPGPWERISTYYVLPPDHRVRDFRNPAGEVWSACELLVGTLRGFRVQLAVFPKRDFARCAEACRAHAAQANQPPEGR